jgi:hypothetical protein
MVSDPDVIPAAFDAGINFFFLTADMHWPLYENTRRGLEKLLARGKSTRDQVVVCSTAYVTQAEFCSAPFEEVIDNVRGLNRIDILVAGGSYSSDVMTRLAVLDQQRGAGFVGSRGIGFSFHDRRAARETIGRDLIDVGFLRFNAAHTGAVREVFPHVEERQRTLLYNFKSTSGWVGGEKLLELGLPDDEWRPRHTDHYRLALTYAAVDGILCSLNTPAQVHELVDALALGPLSVSDEHYLIGLNVAASKLKETARQDAVNRSR